MKKIIIVSFFVFILIAQPPKASAIVCANCSQVVKQILEYATQAKQLVSGVATEISTYMTMYKLLTTDPMTALFGVNVGKQIESSTRNWLMSGFQGAPLIVQNPEAYVKNTYTNSVRSEILKLESQRTASTEGIITSVIKQRRAEITKAPAEVKSNVPAVIQKDLCENGGIEKLVEQEINGPIELGQGSSGSARVQQLYDQFCTVDPNTKEGGQILLGVGAGGNFFSWDAFLAQTGGDNEYVRTNKTILEINRRAAEAAKLAEKESQNGYIADKKCIESFPVKDDDGNVMPGQEDCVSWQVISTAKEVEALATKLKENPLAKANLASIKEKVLGSEALSGLNDLFKGVQDIVSVAQEVGQAVNEVGQAVGQVTNAYGEIVGIVEGTAGALGAGGNPNTARINLIGTTDTKYGTIGSYGTTTYINRSGVATSSQTVDGSTQEDRETVTKPMKETIQKHQLALSKVPEKISLIDSTTNQYQSFINGVRSCVQSIQRSPNYLPATDRVPITSFTNRANVKQEQILNPILAIVAGARQKLGPSNAYLSNLLTSISNARNVAFLLQATQEYQTKLGDGSILPLQADRDLDIVNIQMVEPLQEEINPTNDATKDESIKVLLEDCQSYLEQVNGRGSSYSGG